MNFLRTLTMLSLATSLLAPQFVMAAPGHDHGDSTPAINDVALPRFSAVSDHFELVGVLSGKQITLYLDRSADNSPVIDAQIELEIGGQQYTATKHGSDEFEVILNEAVEPGVLPITAMVIAGEESDLLAGELDIHETSAEDELVHAHSWWEEYTERVIGAAIALVSAAFLVLAVFGFRRIVTSQQSRSGGTA